MLDQSFSGENFRKILDYENRNGNYLEGIYFKEVAKIADSVKCLTAFLRKAPLPPDKYLKVSEKIKSLKKQKDDKLSEELEKLGDKVNSKQFVFQLTPLSGRLSKPIYTLGNSAEIYFAAKQLQVNLRKAYVIKQSNHVQILSQLKNILSGGYPKTVLRTDIQSFYESIPHETLLAKLKKDSLLSVASKRFVSQIIWDYKRLTGLDIGVPRGVGISAYLAELYMRDVDRNVREIAELTYYARYVDDIIAVFTPAKVTDKCNYKAKVMRIITNHRLASNTTKTKCFRLGPKSTRKCSFNYLGYTIAINGSKVELGLSANKIWKYSRKVTVTFAAYRRDAYINERRARRLLIKRLRFFTSNARLLNSKKHILIGVYFSNTFLTVLDGLDTLDTQLKREISLCGPRIKASLMSKYSAELIGFRSGFEHKRFVTPDTAEMIRIHEIW